MGPRCANRRQPADRASCQVPGDRQTWPMQEAIIAGLLFLLLLLSSAVGLFLQGKLAERHRSRETIDAIRLVISILVTFTALVLGLLTSSAKTAFDELWQSAARLRHRYYRARPKDARIWRRARPDARAAAHLCRGGDRRHLARRAATRPATIPPISRASVAGSMEGEEIERVAVRVDAVDPQPRADRQIAPASSPICSKRA